MPSVTTTALPILDSTHFRARFQTELRAAAKITTLQVNIGYVCNLACDHCHVESSPARTGPQDNMDETTARRVVDWAICQPGLVSVDLTGGSPEMNPNFRWMVEALHDHDLHVVDRCNPTIIEYTDRRSGEGFGWVPAFLAGHRVEVIASLPCYSRKTVEKQRGRGSYDASIRGLLKLNAAGYGRDPALRLNLVYNPVGTHLPPPQEALEAEYRRELKTGFGIVFDELWAMTNMPIKRWRHQLERDGRLAGYMNTLIEAYNPTTLAGLMCRHQISVDPQGRLYDCDFNQALGLPTPGLESAYLWDISAESLAHRAIATDDHCYGCTAGCGSSCGGTIV
ncbi:MAG: arsenosugar biosynthesis radical SAM (seleno)protein ArsS [Planctomycetota bacterium]|jgi:radical SAM/Cys-rich protein